MRTKGMGILVLVALIIVAGIFGLVRMQSNPAESTALSDESSLDVSKSQADDAATGTATSSNTTQSKKMDTQYITTPTGLKYAVVKEGTGEVTKNGDLVSVNYTGMLENGTVFDSNVDPKFGHVEPFEFPLGQHMVISGWDEGVLGMKVGEQRRLVIPAALGYGARGAGNLIPPNATLIFDVAVTGIKSK